MIPESKEEKPLEEKKEAPKVEKVGEKISDIEDAEKEKTRVKARSKSVFAPKLEGESREEFVHETQETHLQETVVEEVIPPPTVVAVSPPPPAPPAQPAPPREQPRLPARMPKAPDLSRRSYPLPQTKPLERLGPTGKHIKDLIPPPPPPQPKKPPAARPEPANQSQVPSRANAPLADKERRLPEAKDKDSDDRKEKQTRFKEFRDIKPPKKGSRDQSRL